MTRINNQLVWIIIASLIVTQIKSNTADLKKALMTVAGVYKDKLAAANYNNTVLVTGW